MAELVLAATCHDPLGRFASGIAEAEAVIGDVFASVCVNATYETAAATIEALSTLPRVQVTGHAAGSIGIGTARRDAVRTALGGAATHVVHSDLDHVLRWAATAPDELSSTLTSDLGSGLVVVGRSARSFAEEPERLRATEGLVNRVASLTLGLVEVWDFMIAVRVIDRATAEFVVAHCDEESIANDVVWPLYAARHGRRVSYREVDGLAFRARDDFGAARDQRDGDPLEWAHRVATANRHVQAIAPFAADRPAGQSTRPTRRSRDAL